MRAIIGAMIILAAGCAQQSEKNSQVSATSTKERSATAATAEAKRDVQKLGKDVANVARDAAHATGTAMEKAGKEIQKKTKKP